MRNNKLDKPVRVNWKIVAGKDDLHPIQMYDILLDEQDFRSRQLEIPKVLKVPKNLDTLDE